MLYVLLHQRDVHCLITTFGCINWCPATLKSSKHSRQLKLRKSYKWTRFPTPMSHGFLDVLWDVHSDCFRIRYTPLDIKLTKRGLLSLINLIYDPLGFVAPVLLREDKFSVKLLQSNTSSVSNMHRWIQPPLYLGTTCCPRKCKLRFLLGSSICQKSTKYLFLDSLSTHNA